MRSFHFLVICLLTVPMFAAQAQMADTGFSYRTLQQGPGRSPYIYGAGTARLSDNTVLAGELRLRSSRELIVRETAGARRVISTDRVQEFSIAGHRYVPVRTLNLGSSAATDQLAGAWAEVLREEAGKSQLYEVRGKFIATLQPADPAVAGAPGASQALASGSSLREKNHVYIFRHSNAAPNEFLLLPAQLPTRGYNDDFEAGLRQLFAQRPDLLKHVDRHYITAFNLPAAIDALDSGAAMQF